MSNSSDYLRKLSQNKYRSKDGLSIRMAERDVRDRERARKYKEGEKIDTKIRKELQLSIRELARTGKSVSQIVNELTTNPEYEKFSKFGKYFVGYAENHVNKFVRQNKESREDFGER